MMYIGRCSLHVHFAFNSLWKIWIIAVVGVLACLHWSVSSTETHLFNKTQKQKKQNENLNEITRKIVYSARHSTVLVGFNNSHFHLLVI